METAVSIFQDESTVDQVIIGSVVYFRVATSNPPFLQQLAKAFTFTPVAPRVGKKIKVKPPESTCLFRPLAGQPQWYCIPRTPDILRVLSPINNEKVQDIQTSPCSGPPPLRFTKDLDNARRQVEATDAVISEITSTPWGGGATLSLPPGYGKTACALYITTRVASRVLILVHTTVLLRQWVDRIADFVEGVREVVAITPQTYGNGPADWPRGPGVYVIVLIQTVLARYSAQHESLCSSFDMVIVDETHHLAAKTLCKVMEVAGCRYRLGLSGTLERKDGMHSMLEHLLGPMAFRVQREHDTRLLVEAVTFSLKEEEIGDKDLNMNFVDAVSFTSDNPRRNAVLLQVILSKVREGRCVIVMSGRRSQLTYLGDRLSEDYGITPEWGVGGSKLDPTRIGEGSVLLATYEYAAEGLDVPVLNTCILATSKVDLRQCIGRILRNAPSSSSSAATPEEDDIQNRRPLVVDVHDTDIPILHRQYLARKRFFLKPLHKDGMGATEVVSTLGAT